MSSPPDPALPVDEVEVERIVRAALVELFSGIAGLPHVIGAAIHVEGEGEYVKAFSFANTASKAKEFRLLEIMFSDFADLSYGCDDRPSFKLIYTINLLIQFSALAKVRGGAGAVSSTDDFARIVLTLRRRVLDGRNLGGYKQLRADNLQPVASRFGADDDLKLRAAHFAQFALAVEVTPSPLA